MATNAELSKKINDFNKNRNNKSSIKISLSPNTDFIKNCHPKFLTPKSAYYLKDKLLDYFLIKKDGKYVGIVYDGFSDLHIYIKQQYRGQTVLIKELNEVIIPYLLINRDEQNMTFINKKVETYFLKHLKNITSNGVRSAVIVKNKEPIFNVSQTYRTFTEKEFKLFKIRALVVLRERRKLYNYCDKNLGTKWLIRQTYITDSDFDFLREEERKTVTQEIFNSIQTKINYTSSLETFYNEQIKLLYGKEKSIHILDYIDERVSNYNKNIELLKINSF